MKKLISVILCISLLVSLCAVTGYATDDVDLAYAVASDLHFTFPEETLTWYSEDPIFGYANRRAAMENESGLIIQAMLDQVAADDDIDFLLVPGDITDNGKSIAEEHIAVAEMFKNFEETSGKQVYVIPGNHDYCKPANEDGTDLETFTEIYKDFGLDEALTVDEGCFSYTANLGEKYRLIALDSNDPTKSTEDGMTKHKVNWVVEQAEQAYEDGRYPILMMHHNLLEHMPIQRVLSHDFIIRNHTSTANKWANAGIKLVFSGHEHCSDATTHITSSGNTISDFATTSLTMYPLQYRYIEMTEENIYYEAKTVESIDTDKLLEMIPDYSEAQINAMNEDLNEYAKQFLKNGVEYRLERGFNDEQLGIKKSDIYYDLVRGAVDALNDTLNMPLYGEGSAQELARTYNIEIPDSDYKDGWDVATELVAAHYAGCEDYPLYEKDCKILFLVMSLVIKEEFAFLDDQVFLSAAASMIALYGGEPVTDIVEMLTDETEGVTAAEYFIIAIASPLLHSFANDDGVDDNNGAIDGYGNTDKGENMGNNFMNIASDIGNHLYTILRYLVKILNIFLAE